MSAPTTIEREHYEKLIGRQITAIQWEGPEHYYAVSNADKVQLQVGDVVEFEAIFGDQFANVITVNGTRLPRASKRTQSSSTMTPNIPWEPIVVDGYDPQGNLLAHPLGGGFQLIIPPTESFLL